MCHILNKNCINCTRTFVSETSLCAEGLRGNICVITPMNAMNFSTKISHPRTGSRMYVDLKPYLVVIMKKDMCSDCIMRLDISGHDIEFIISRLKKKEMKVDSEHISAMIHGCKMRDVERVGVD